MSTDPWPGFDALRQRLHGLVDPDATPLMEEWRRIIVEGNRRGVLSGIDGFGRAMTPLKYRDALVRPAANRRGARFGTREKPKSGFGPWKSGLNDNLTSAQYRQLTGPRLAPRRTDSRVIKDLETAHGRDPANHYQWYAIGKWYQVVDTKGRPFLMAHFEPKAGSHLPRYDLRPVRPEDKRRARQACREWIRDELRRAVGR